MLSAVAEDIPSAISYSSANIPATARVGLWSPNIEPIRAAHNETDLRLVNAKLGCEFGLPNATPSITFSNLGHLCGRELRFRVDTPARGPFLAHHVGHVVVVRAREQVTRIAAEPHIARMTNLLTPWNWSN